MCEEKQYEWNINYKSISVNSILNTTPECREKENFKLWCFDRFYNTFSKIILKSIDGDSLLEELHKPERKTWLDFAIKQGHVREVKEIFGIGDVIEITDLLVDIESKYIINICKEDTVCLNNKKGTRWRDMFSVEDVENIKYEEIYNRIRKKFKKIGNGIKYLL